MRLVQLALKLGLAQHEIITYLQENGITIPENGNVKLLDEHVTMVIDHFGLPEKNVIDEAESLTAEITDEQLPEATADIAEVFPNDQGEAEANISSEPQFGPEESRPPVEVIRAKKIKLEGIKVVGKIDLPESEKKTAEKSPADDEETKKPATTRTENFGRKRKKKRPATSKNSRAATPEEKSKRKEKEAAKKQRELEKKIKLKRKLYYQKQLKITQTEKAKKKAAKKSPEPTPRKKAVRYKNPVRRLWAWLNGKYD